MESLDKKQISEKYDVVLMSVRRKPNTEGLNLEGLPTVIKTRYLWNGGDGLLWEVDEFEGRLSGLIIAEVELESEDQEVSIPSWVGLELTHLKGWSNAALAEMIGQQ